MVTPETKGKKKKKKKKKKLVSVFLNIPSSLI
jgi:hypothetical protein